jgi:hypothetical protein
VHILFTHPRIWALKRGGMDEPAMLHGLCGGQSLGRIRMKKLDDERPRERRDVERKEERRIAWVLPHLKSIRIVCKNPLLESSVRGSEGGRRVRDMRCEMDAHLNRGQALRSRPNGNEPVKRPYKITPALHMSTLRPS